MHFSNGVKRRLAMALTGAFAIAPAWSATSPQALVTALAADARAADPGFLPSASRGKAFYERAHQPGSTMSSCSSCHTPDPAVGGRHVVTGRAIAPLSPRAQPDRFTDEAKVEKWFRRNCNDVLARACTAAEKADLLEYLMQGRK